MEFCLFRRLFEDNWFSTENISDLRKIRLVSIGKLYNGREGQLRGNVNSLTCIYLLYVTQSISFQLDSGSKSPAGVEPTPFVVVKWHWRLYFQLPVSVDPPLLHIHFQLPVSVDPPLLHIHFHPSQTLHDLSNWERPYVTNLRKSGWSFGIVF